MAGLEAGEGYHQDVRAAATGAGLSPVECFEVASWGNSMEFPGAIAAGRCLVDEVESAASSQRQARWTGRIEPVDDRTGR